MSNPDVFYFLGPEAQTPADDWEMRLSMRSFYEHLTPRRFVIVGHLPAWLNPDNEWITHVRWTEACKHNKDANLISKLLYVAGWSDHAISDPFIAASDDQFILRRPTYDELFTPSHDGPISSYRKIPGHSWWERLHRTGEALRRHKFSDLHFDTHIPHLVHKRHLPEVLRWAWCEGNGFCIFSLLFNANRVAGGRIDRSRIRAGLYGADIHPETIEKKLAANLYASIDADSLRCRPLVKALEARFPIPGPWETYPMRSPLQNPVLHPPASASAPFSPPPDFNYDRYTIA